MIYSILALLAGAAMEKTVPAINTIDAWQQVGQQPYELTWTQREQDPNTLVDFENLTDGRSNCYWASAKVSSLTKAGTAISIQSWRGRS